MILLTEISHGQIKINIVQFVFPEPSNRPQWISCTRTHLFKVMAEDLHTSNTRIDKAYKELRKKGIITIKKDQEVRLTENDTVIQLLAIQKRIVYFEEKGKRHFPNMFNEDFMLNNFTVKAGVLSDSVYNTPYIINPKYQNDFDAYCFQMDSLFKDVSMLALSMSNKLIEREYDYVIGNLTLMATNVIIHSIKHRLRFQSDQKLTPKSDYNTRRLWELLIQFRTKLPWLIQFEKKPKFGDWLCGTKYLPIITLKKYANGSALHLTPDEKKYLKIKKYSDPNAEPNSNFKKIPLNSKLWKDSSFDQIIMVIIYGSGAYPDCYMGIREAGEVAKDGSRSLALSKYYKMTSLSCEEHGNFTKEHFRPTYCPADGTRLTKKGTWWSQGGGIVFLESKIIKAIYTPKRNVDILTAKELWAMK